MGLRGDPAGVAWLSRALPGAWRRVASGRLDRLYTVLPAPRGSLELFGGASRLARSRDPVVLARAFESDVSRRVAEASRQRLFVHAGAVGWRGRGVLIPGRSLSGKSSLVAALVRAGASYYSDEYAVLDGRGRVHPFPLPVALRRPGGGRVRLAPGALGRVGRRPVRVGLVLVARYRSGAVWSPRPLSRGRGLLAVLAHAVPVRSRPESTLERLSRTVCAAAIVRGVRGESAQVVQWLHRHYGPPRGG